MRKLAIVVAAAAVAVVVVLLLARGSSTPSIAPTSTAAVRATFEPAAGQFGDPLTARVVVILDRDAVRPESLQVTNDLAPLTALGPQKTTRTVSGRLETVTITQPVACLTTPCLARRITLPRVRVSVAGRDGGTTTASAPWQRLLVRSRITPAELAKASPPFAADAGPGTPSYRVAPGTAATVLVVVAALAAAGAAGLLAFEGLALARRRRRVATGDEVDRALRLVREAENRPVPDRRRALALLARLVPGSGASDLAWSEPAPDSPAIDAVVTQIEGGRAS